MELRQSVVDGWTLRRHWNGKDVYPAAIYWMRPVSDEEYEIRNPVKPPAPGVDHLEILPPDRSTPSGRFPLEAIEKHYVMLRVGEAMKVLNGIY